MEQQMMKINGYLQYTVLQLGRFFAPRERKKNRNPHLPLEIHLDFTRSRGDERQNILLSFFLSFSPFVLLCYNVIWLFSHLCFVFPFSSSLVRCGGDGGNSISGDGRKRRRKEGANIISLIRITCSTVYYIGTWRYSRQLKTSNIVRELFQLWE